jgi:serine/threonine-protein kinase HipA
MTNSLTVILDDAMAGTVSRLQGGRLRFDYDDAYRAMPNATPLSVSMPKSVRTHSNSVITPWLWGLLPDNEAVLARWAREFHTSASPFALLSTPIGHDCAGAVRFAKSEEAGALIAQPRTVTWLSEHDVAQRLRELQEDTTSWLGRDFSGQFSLAGAQAKTALLFQEGRWGLPSGSAATSHILKPAVAGFDEHDLNEHLCLDAARRAGLVVARTRIGQFEDESAIVVDRYDRRLVEGKLIRIHQEDVCQALGRHPERKYQNRGGPGPDDVARLMRNVMPARAADDAVWRFLDALVWNWLIVGTDAHAKNYSLLLVAADVRLAPLYDIASALPYATHERELRFAMKIGGDYRVVPFHNTWPAAARELGLNPDAAQQRVLELARRAPDAFAEAAADPDVIALNRPLPDRLVGLVTDRVERCLAILGDTSAKAGRVLPDAYEERLVEIVEASTPQTLDPAGGPPLIRQAVDALSDAVAASPRDLGLVRERMVELGASALRTVRAIGESEPPPGFANPTTERLRAMIDDYAPNIANLPIATDDPVVRVVDEMVKAANRYVDADPKSIYGSAQERLRALFRVIGLAGRGLAL